MTNAKRQKKFRDKMRDIRNSPYTMPIAEKLFTERKSTSGDLWRIIKIWQDHGHVEIAKVSIVGFRSYRKARIVSLNVLKVNYVEVSEKAA